MENQRFVEVCAACHERLDGPAGLPCEVADGRSHAPVSVRFATGDEVRVREDLTDVKRGGRWVTYVRAGAVGTVRGMVGTSSGGWRWRVQVRSQQYWFGEDDLELLGTEQLTA